MSLEGVTLVYMEPGDEVTRIAAAQAGDSASFLVLVRQYGRPLYRAAFALTRDPQTAGVLTRDAFVQAWEEIHTFPSGQRFFPWLLRIARRLFPTPTPGSQPTRDDADGRVLGAFSELRPEEQAVLSLRVMERIPYEDIANVLGLSLGVATLRLSQARGHLLSSPSATGGDAA